MKEEKLQDEIEAELKEQHGKENVHREKYLQESDRYVDFYVEGTVPLAIEVENGFDSVLKGVGQALIYAQELKAVPVIIVPESEIEQPEADHLSSNVTVIGWGI